MDLNTSITRFQGQPWSNWTDVLGRLSPAEDTKESAKRCLYKPSTTIVKLQKKDMGLFGFCPERDPFVLAVCNACQAVVKPQALKLHIDRHHSANSISKPSTSKSPAAKPVKSVMKNGKSKVRLKKPASIVIAKADSTTVPVNNDLNNINNKLIMGASSKPMDITIDATVVSSTTNTADTIAAVASGILPNNVSNATVNKSTIGMNGPTVMLTQPNSELQEENPVSSSSPFVNLTVVSRMDTSDKVPVDNNTQANELHPVVTPSPLVPVSVPASPVTLVTKPPTPSPISISVKSPSNNIPPVNAAAPASISSKSLPAKPRRIVRAERKFVSAKEREYDADKHCGVIINDAKPCTRSLTCSLHSRLMRRGVEGRSKPFDQLLAEHRATKETTVRKRKNNQSHNHNIHPLVVTVQMDSVSNTISSGTNKVRGNATAGAGVSILGSNAGGCGPPEMGIRIPISLLSPSSISSQTTSTLGSSTSELMSATPSDSSSNSPLTPSISVNGTQFLSRQTLMTLTPFKTVELPEAATSNISTAVDITFTRTHPKPLSIGLFNSRKMGGLFYQNKKFAMARHYINDLQDL